MLNPGHSSSFKYRGMSQALPNLRSADHANSNDRASAPRPEISRPFDVALEHFDEKWKPEL
jgi:hypothetical protein